MTPPRTPAAKKAAPARKAAAKKAPSRSRSRGAAEPSLPAPTPAPPSDEPGTASSAADEASAAPGQVEQAVLDELRALGKHQMALAAVALRLARAIDEGSASTALAAAPELRLELQAIRGMPIARPATEEANAADKASPVTPPTRLERLRQQRASGQAKGGTRGTSRRSS